MDKQKLRVVIVSFALGGLSALAFVLINGVIQQKKEQKKFLDSVYGEGYIDSLGA